VQQRNINAGELVEVLKQSDFIETPVFKVSEGNRHAYYRLYAKVKKQAIVNGERGEKLRNLIVSRMVAVGVPCFFGSCAEVYREKLFAKFAPKTRLVNAASFSDDSFCFLVHHTITNSQLQAMKSNIKHVLTSLITK
jgi:dTDP-4-amino-4,6-dideoxygalactose transaminase